MTKELRKEIYIRSKLKNKYNRNATEENKAISKKQRNKGVYLYVEKRLRYISKMSRKSVFKLIKTFGSELLENAKITSAEKDKIVHEEKEL